ncbi:MAG: hypothetical protein JW882_22010 [Deltaproteobacteria bacterium]|nr:hypothetical protein [Deltaproteobacteria bacterium]
MECYFCNGAKILKYSFEIPIKKADGDSKKFSIRGEFRRKPDMEGVFMLCKDCMARAFEECAEILKKMSEDEFKMII